MTSDLPTYLALTTRAVNRRRRSPGHPRAEGDLAASTRCSRTSIAVAHRSYLRHDPRDLERHVLAGATTPSSWRATTTPATAIRCEHFEPSERHTTCPWKGMASYYDIVAGDDQRRRSIVYPETKPPRRDPRRIAFWRGVQVQPAG